MTLTRQLASLRMEIQHSDVTFGAAPKPPIWPIFKNFQFPISNFSTLWSLTIMVMVDYIMKMGVSRDVYIELSHCRYGLLTVLRSYTVYKP